jgi:predicted P-loop ATPase
MLPIVLDRKIARLEAKRDEVYCEAMQAYHEGPNWALPKLEAKVEEMNEELERLERMRACPANGEE